LFHTQLDTLDAKWSDETLVTYLRRPEQSQIKEELICFLVEQLKFVHNLDKLRKGLDVLSGQLHLKANRNIGQLQQEQQERQDSFMALIYYKTPTDILPLALDIMKKLQQNSPSWNFIRDFKKNRINQLCLAIAKGKLSVVPKLKQLDLINMRNSKGFMPVHIAAFKGYLELLLALIEAGADINAVGETEKKETLLHLAVLQGHIKVVKVLVDLGLDVNLTNNQNRTPLCIAVVNGNLKIVKTLVESGAKINPTRMNTSINALFIAAHLGHLDIVIYFLTKNASPFITFKTSKEALLKEIHDEGLEVQARAQEFIKSKGQIPNSKEGFWMLPSEIAHIMGHLEIEQCLRDSMAEQKNISNTDYGFFNKNIEGERQEDLDRMSALKLG
jgi:ankyrin repeat protein